MRQLQIAKRAALIRMHGARYARRQDEGRLRFVAVRLAECSDSDPEHGQLVPLDLLDRAILEIISLGCAANILTGSEYARFEEAWRDK